MPPARERWTTRRMMGLVALAALAVWAGLNRSTWRESFDRGRADATHRFNVGTTNAGEGVAGR